MNQLKYIILLAFAILAVSHVSGQYHLQYLADHPGANFYEVVEAVEEYYKDKPQGRGSGYKHFRNWKMAMEPYFYPSGEMYNVNAMLYSEHRKYIHKPKAGTRSNTGFWFDQGPTSFTQGTGDAGGNGVVSCIEFHPTDPDLIYVGTPDGGMWRYDMGSSSWTPLTDGVPTIGVSGIAINYNNPNIMYILTGDGNRNNSPSIGVLKTTNGGQTWLPTDLTWAIQWDYPQTNNAYKLLMHPTDPDILFVVAEDGIHRTTNGGDTWTNVKPGKFWDIEFKPDDPSVMYASGFSFFRSTNTGLTWNVDGDPDFPTQYLRTAIGVTPAEPDYVYLLFGGHVNGTGAGSFSGLFRSDDAGLDFEERSTTPNIIGWWSDGQDSINQALINLVIAVDPQDAETVFAGGINNWKSSNGGTTWSLASHWVDVNNEYGYVHADQHDLKFLGSDIYAACDGGLFRSDDDGATWDNLSDGLSIMQFTSIDVAGSNYIGGAWDNGCNQWSASNSDATHIVRADGFVCMIDPTNTNIRYMSNQGGKWRSTNGGGSWNPINIPSSGGYWDSDWIMDPVSTNRMYMAGPSNGNHDVFRTTSSGTGTSAWTDLNAGFSINQNIIALAQGVNDRDVLYAAIGTELRKSTNVNDPAPGWSDITGTLPVGSAVMRGIAVDPANANRVWVCFRGVSSGNKVYYSPNGGTNWYNESGTLPNVPVNCIAYVPGSQDGLYIGTDIGVFYRNDYIGDWEYHMNGLPTVRVLDMDIDGGYIYAGTFGRGLWRSPLYTSCPTSYYLTTANDPSNPNYTGVQRYYASQSIYSSRVITGGIGTDVLYTAADEITFTSGFHARAHNDFEAKLGGCPD